MARTRPPFAPKPALESPEQIARDIRLDMIVLSHQAQIPLPKASFSCVEILVALYWNVLRIDPSQADDANRDRFLFNKGSGITALYSVLARRGFIPHDELKQFNKEGCRLNLHPAPCSIPGLERSPGLPGRTLSLAAGMALAAKLLNQTHRVITLIDSREFDPEVIAAPARIASQQGLSSLIAIVETPPPATSPDLTQNPSCSPVAYWQSCGWETCEVDGHDPLAITKALGENRAAATRPLALIASTTAGRGVEAAGGDPWKNRPPSDTELEAARKELAP